MKKYAGIVLCSECEYQAYEKSTDTHWCGNTQGLDVIWLKPGDGCSRGKRKEMLPEAGAEAGQDAAAPVLQPAT